MRFWDKLRMTKSVFLNDNEFEYWKRIIKCHMIWRRVSKSWREWLKYFTVCVANDLKYWMAETYFDRRKSKTRVFWLLFCSQKSDRKISRNDTKSLFVYDYKNEVGWWRAFENRFNYKNIWPRVVLIVILLDIRCCS